VMKKCKVGTIFHNDSDATTGAWKAVLKAAKENATEIVPVNGNTKTDLFQILVAYDGRGRFSNEANNSILVLLVDGDVRVLLTGDCEAACEKAVSPHLTKIDVLNVGHHGSNAASSPPFLTLLSPKLATISAGRTISLGIRPSPSLAA
jgi:beta-lactamase superfamily II metal-dependent hydrolase